MQHNHLMKLKAAFTIMELSIVLVIIGLLAGGTLIGQQLIHMAELSAIASEANRYGAALVAFREKYEAMPGDMKNATEYWGAADAGDGLGSDCGDVESQTLTCNGNGDGVISTLVADGVWEKLRAWQQLADAGLIVGNYTGALTAGDSFIGPHFPPARIKPAGYEMTSEIVLYQQQKGNVHIKIAAKASNDTTGLNGGFLSPRDSWALDKKMDDGLPYSGKLVAIDSADVAGCVTNGTVFTAATTGTYVLTSEAKSCRFYFYPGI